MKVILHIREHDIDGKPIPLIEEYLRIKKAVADFWNVDSIEITNDKGKKVKAIF